MSNNQYLIKYHGVYEENQILIFLTGNTTIEYYQEVNTLEIFNLFKYHVYTNLNIVNKLVEYENFSIIEIIAVFNYGKE